MAGELKHVQIGLGKFGLGYAVPFAQDFGFSSILVNRQPARPESKRRCKALEDHSKYVIRHYDEPSNETLVAFDHLVIADGSSAAAEALAKVVADPNTALVTTAVGEAELPGLADILASGLQRREEASPPVSILACENLKTASSSLEDLVRQRVGSLALNVKFLNCVVDRICTDADSFTETGLVAVTVEKYRHLAVQADGMPDVLHQAIAPHVGKDVDLVGTQDLDLYYLRKLWLVNGFHLALAVVGARASNLSGEKTLVADVIRSPDTQQFVKGIKNELITALNHLADGRVGFTLKNLKSYMDTIEQRFAASPDDCARVLHDALLGDARIRNISERFGTDLGLGKTLQEAFVDHLYRCIFVFFKKVQDRLYAPVAQLSSEGSVEYRWLPYVLQEIVPLMMKQADALVRQTADSPPPCPKCGYAVD